MATDAAGNLLFGLLALQNGMITRDQLVAAFSVWTGAARRSMAEILVEHGALTPPRRALLEALTAEHLAAHGGDPDASLAALDMGPSTRDTLAHAGFTSLEPTLARLGTDRGAEAGAEANWRRVCEVFASVIRRPPSDRAVYLDGACAGDLAVRAEVERLIADDSRATAEGFLDVPNLPPVDREGGSGTVTTTLFPADGTIHPGQRFRLLRPHAKGGLGAVYVALDSELNREVALKQILDDHADNPASRQRFLLEAEITGGLEHPGIVPVYGLGTYDGGRPYYAMRFIKGDSLKEAVERFRGDAAVQADPGRRSLELRKLLRRFIDVCNAIDYAHSRGVLHRDIKPGNIIVGKYGETLVVDWGLAKSLGRSDRVSDSGERTLIPSAAIGSAETLPGSALGTPAYMSPEQAAGALDRLGPRSDVYGLGATLYALLTGKGPFAGDRFEVLRKVERGEFSPPRQLDPSIDPALEAVCLRAMAQQPEDRYATCRALADDIERWTADEPVTAYREPFVRRARRWAKRNRTVVASAAVALVVSVVGLLALTAAQAQFNADLSIAHGATQKALEKTRKAQEATTAALVQSEESRKRADAARAQSEESRQQAEAVGNFLVDALKKPDPTVDGKDVKVADVLGQAAAALEQGFSGPKATEGALLDALGRAYSGLGLYPKAVEVLDKARAVREAVRGLDHPETLQSRNELAKAYLSAGRTAESIQMHQANLELRERKLGPDHPDTLDSRGNLATAYYAAGRTAEAITLLVPTLQQQEAKLGPGHRHTLRSRNDLALAYWSVGRNDEAITLLEANLKLWETKFGPDYHGTLISRNNLAIAYKAAGRIDEAIQMHQANLEARERKLGPDHPETLGSRHNLASAYGAAGRTAAAITLHEANHTLTQAKLGLDHPDTLQGCNNLALAYLSAGRTAEAIAMLEANLELRERKLGPDHLDTLDSRSNLAGAYDCAGRTAAAITLLKSTLDRQEAKLGPDHPDTLKSRHSLAIAYLSAGRTAAAITLHEANLRVRERKYGPDHPQTLESRLNLASAYGAAGRWAVAERLYRQTLTRRRQKVKPDNPLLAGDLADLGRSLLKLSRWPEAEPLLRESLAIREKAIPGEYRRFSTMSLLGGALSGQEKYAEAEPLVVGGYEGIKAREATIAANARYVLSEAEERVVQLYKDWGKPEQAAAWASKLGLADLPADVFAPR